MRPTEEVEAARELSARGFTTAAIARELAMPYPTVRKWVTGDRRVAGARTACCRCQTEPSLPSDGGSYAHLLGLYLGDGGITTFPRGVHRLEIFQDALYPGLIARAADSVRAVMPHNKVGFRQKPGAVAVGSYSKHWPCLFPQHGPGPKHTRSISLTEWQQEVSARHTKALVAGLYESDGCRVVNRVKSGRYAYVRYLFTNRSDDIRGIFTAALELLGVHWTTANAWNIAVSRRDDVEFLDSFLGPKR